MLLLSLLFTPIIGILVVLINKDNGISLVNIKFIALASSIFNFFISLIIFILFDFSTNQFQFVQEYHKISYFDFYLGVDGLSIYFILLTTLIIPISLISNWKSIIKDVESFVIIILLLETLLLAVFLVLDILLFYIFFESILPPLFILIGIFGSDNRVKASFYLFLYTLFGSLFLLLSILAMSSIMSTTDFDTLFKGNFLYITQLFLFYGIFIAFAVKTPTIFLNTWLLKAHVESPLGGSIILAAIVLKLSLYGILRLILPILPKAYMEYTYIIFLIGVITIIYASLSTLRTIDIKELIAYSSVSHAAVYLLGVFSNSIQGIEGSINLGLAHGLVSPGLFICAGGVLYDRSSTRVISFYKGVAQVMPLFAILFFILCLANCGAPLSLNFIGEFLSLYGVFEKSSLFGLFASSSIIFSAAYTIYMYQRIAFGGSYSRMFAIVMPDLTKREFTVLLILVIPTIFFGIYPAPILDAIHYSTSTLIYCFDSNVISCEGSKAWNIYFQINTISCYTFIALLYWIVVISLAIIYNNHIKTWYVNNIKYWYNTDGKYLLYAIFRSLPLPFLLITLFYIIVYLHNIFCAIFFGLYNNILMYYPLHDYAMANGIDSHSLVFDSSSAKVQDHIYLSSRGSSHPYLSDNRGTHVPQNMQGQEVPTTHPTQNIQGQGVPTTHPSQNAQIYMVPGTNPPKFVQIHRIPGSNPPLFRQVEVDPRAYGIQNIQFHEPAKPSLFKANWQETYTPYVPKPPKSPVLAYGQGENPVLWTIAEHGERLTRFNTFNIATGQVDYCERTSSTHGWMQWNNWDHSKHTGPCFNCRNPVSNVYYSCEHCFRRVCSGCNDNVFDRIPEKTMEKLRENIRSRK